MHTVATVCPHDCPDRCSILVEVDDAGVVKRLRGDPEHLHTDGFLCGKVTRYSKRNTSPERVLQPLRRLGRKGEGRFEAISWSEALQEISAKITAAQASDGPTAVGIAQGTGSLGALAQQSVYGLAHHLGATLQVGSICAGESKAGWQAGAGRIGGSDPRRILAAERIVIWGCNAAVSNMHLFGLVKKAVAGGARLIVIDPYETLTARKAALHVKPFPGTDGALALGLCRLLAQMGAWDSAFLAAHGSHVAEFAAHCDAHYDLERVAAITRIEPQQIVALANELASTSKIFLRAGIGMTRHSYGGHAVWAIAALATVRGVFQEAGGGFLGMTRGLRFNTHFLQGPAAPARTFHVNALGKALTELRDPPLKVLLVIAGNPLATSPSQALVRQGFSREDLFTVVHEQFLTDTADYADLVLPAATFLEHDDWHDSYGHYDVQRQRKAVEPAGEAVSNCELARRLADALGWQDTWFQRSEEELMRATHAASQLPWDYETLSDGKPHTIPVVPEPTAAGFADNGFDGKFRFMRPDFAALGLPVMPGHYEGSWGVSQLQADEFHLMSPPTMDLLNSSFGQSGDGQHEHGSLQGSVLMSRADAQRLGLNSGDEVELYNAYGSIRRTLRLTAEQQPQLLVIEGVFWTKQLAGRGGVNALTSERSAAMSGVPAFHEVVVRIR